MRTWRSKQHASFAQVLHLLRTRLGIFESSSGQDVLLAGSISNTSVAAPPMEPCLSASARACSFIIPPLPTLTDLTNQQALSFL